MLMAGFTSQLKGWWDNYLSPFLQNEILTSVKTEENGEILWDENNEEIPDAVATLVFAISQHFIGDPSHLKDKNLELLSNLKYKRLSDFRQYKDTFLTRVMSREDCNQPFWKEKFLAESSPDSEEGQQMDELGWSSDEKEIDQQEALTMVGEITAQRWLIKITLIINHDLKVDATALFETGANENCINEQIIPTRFYEKTTELLSSISDTKLDIRYKLSQVDVEQNRVRHCKDQPPCGKNPCHEHINKTLKTKDDYELVIGHLVLQEPENGYSLV
ncbi:hypothetical protein CRG98_025870 [Punica granatum]|uniref:DUF7746 domain-containing protein n=1 Tax=Punica granatum TaxID=22663 RepID=A0A2I0JCU6_PUNGR|nr:hypothetical protein CRG98_025870 [Punica granatum]